MNNISVLDCTLRDGGYVNDWDFGKANIKFIINKLIEADIDIIECGFLTETKSYCEDKSLFNTISQLKDYLPEKKTTNLTVCMINYGEYDIKNLPEYDGTSIDGIRVAFHKRDIQGALEFCKGIVQKGYKLFIQPMVSVLYTDEEFIKLIKESNEIKPYAFYIVDSFGVMKRKSLMRLYYLVDHNLDDDIYVGYHSHNNIQMAYSNAQSLVDLKTKRKLIIDSSVFGMGRGAGNLNTELFIEYLNEDNNKSYRTKPLLQIIDRILGPIYLNNYWGYSLPHYASAIYNCHPNYASYLDDKSTLTIENINEILKELDDFKKVSFDKEYIESLYNQYQAKVIEDESSEIIMQEIFKDKIALLIAPGSSINTERDKIKEAIKHPNTVVVSINFEPDNFICDYTFVSNLRRYEDLKDKLGKKLIVTSNIRNENINGYKVNYSKLLNDVNYVEDNSAMMLIKLLIDSGIKDIKLAGMDGYSYDLYDNFAEKDMAFLKSNSVMDAMNVGINKMIKKFSREINIEFVTTPKNIKLGDN